MQLPVYVSVEEVQRVCKALNIRDWTALTDGSVTTEEARAVLAEVDANGMDVDVESFRRGLEVELEHGTRFPSANVTNNHPILTAKIVMAHFEETLDYYDRLEVAELEGDLLKAALSGNAEKLLRVYKKLLAAKNELAKVEVEQAAGGK
jgi:hypothetical protein